MTKSELFENVTYNPDTGLFTRLRKTAHNAVIGKPIGTVAKNGYVVIRIGNKLYYAHRLAWLYMTGEFPKYTVDHINRNRTDNKWGNLRDVDGATNAQNTAHGRGRHFHKPSGRFKSSICVNYKQVHLGYYSTADGAEHAYLAAKQRYHNQGA